MKIKIFKQNRSPSKIKQSVLTLVAQYLIAIIVLASTVISISLAILLSSQSDAESINMAGSLRMQAYRLGYQIQSDPLSPEHNLRQYRKSLHAGVLNELNNSLFVPNEVKQNYRDLIQHWNILEQYIKNGDIANYQANVNAYVEQVDQFVSTLQHFSEHKLVIVMFMSFLAILTIIVLGSYVIWFVKKEVIRPLYRLVTASTQVQTGQFNHIPLTMDKPNELGVLASTFTQMSQELQKLYWSLEEKVNEKTQKLSQLNRSLSTLYRLSQIITATEIEREKLKEALQAIKESQHLRYIELNVYGAEHLNVQLGEENIQYVWQEQEIKQNGQELSLLRWQCGIPCPDLQLMESIAQMLGRAVFFAQTQRQQQQLVLMEERSIIARELHDSLAQVLSFLQIQLTLLKHGLNKLEGESKEQCNATIKEFEQALSDGYVQLRELLATFRLTVQEANLKLALEQVIDSLRNRTDAQIILHCSLPSQIFTAQQQVHALQIIREALLNAIKHANASLIEVIARTNEYGENELIVNDNGIGIPTLDEPEGHYGLHIMFERSRQLNAKLSIGRRAEGGTEVKIMLQNQLP